MAKSRHTERIIPFRSKDGFQCNLVHVTRTQPPTKSPILLVHGAGVRSRIFQAPVRETIVDALLEDGYDVWMENWRASLDLEPNLWNLDRAAINDHPAAVAKVLEETGAETIKALIHCQGSTSFAMSAVAGLVPQVDTILSNAVSLHPVVPKLSGFKLKYVSPLVALTSRYLNPQWGEHAPGIMPKLINAVVEATHHECDNGVCKHVSFAYGSGFPALWSHENLNDETHEWLKKEFAWVPFKFYKQITKSVRKGHLVSMRDSRGTLPLSFIKEKPKTDARWIFFAGENNKCFLPESQTRTFDFMNHHDPGRHSLQLLPGYGHLDVFMGKDAGKDVFPIMIEELNRTALPNSA